MEVTQTHIDDMVILENDQYITRYPYSFEDMVEAEDVLVECQMDAPTVQLFGATKEAIKEAFIRSRNFHFEHKQRVI